MKNRVAPVLLPCLVALVFIAVWHVLVVRSGSDIFPTPRMVLSGIVELFEKGVLWNYIVASLFRVSAGFLLAVAVGIPIGLILGWFTPALWAGQTVISRVEG